MGVFSSYAQKHVLDFVLGGAAATQPSGRWLALTSNGTEFDASIVVGYSRLTAQFAPAAMSPEGAAMLSASTFGPFTIASSAIIVHDGLQIWDASTLGNLLIESSFTPANTFRDRGGIVVASLVVTLA